MSHINPYLTFSGNCREAMTFYKQCLGGELIFQTVNESPMADKLPQQMRDYILHSALTNGNLILMGSDIVREEGLVVGNSISLMLNCNSEDEIHQFFKNLSNGGITTHPVGPSFWDSLFGELTDKFGNHWILNYEKNNH
jgi:PhnB protein